MKKRMHRRNAALLFSTVMLGSMTMPIRAEETVTQTDQTQAVQEASLPSMTLEEYPHLDGSLACVPLLEKLAQLVTGCTETEAEETLWDFVNTNPSYLALAQRERDMILAYEPAQETTEELAAYDPLIMQPVGKDALVFIVNKDNPVESVTKEQMYDIFTGKITNWSEVGGNDEEIKAFRRPETSGSQTMMRKLLIGDAEMVEEQMEQVESMSGIIDAIKEYDNSANAIGYSVYYYASSMYDQPELKFLSVDGVEPSNETIRSGEYPLVNDFYCVLRQDSPENAVALSNWLLSEEGQSFVEECGYVPAF